MSGVNGYEDAEPESSAEQITFPEESVVSAPPFPSPEQLICEIVSPPELIRIPPANVDVAVDVAKIAAKLGVVVPITLPEGSVERITLEPTFES